MEPENLDIESIMDARRETVEQNIQPISIDELKSLGEKMFPFLDHPWRHMFFQFLEENSGSTVYHATTNDQIEVLYCPDKAAGHVVPFTRGCRSLGGPGTRDLEGDH